MDKTHSPGFTLIELLAALAVVAILSTTAAPAMARAWQRANVLQVLHATTSSLAVARTVAITRGEPVTLCPSRDGSSCSGELDWSSGWIVFVDPGRRQQPASQERIIEVVAAINGNLALHSSAGRPRIRYLPHGWASGSNASLNLCSKGNSAHLLASVIINNAGRTRVVRPAESPDCPER